MKLFAILVLDLFSGCYYRCIFIAFAGYILDFVLTLLKIAFWRLPESSWRHLLGVLQSIFIQLWRYWFCYICFAWDAVFRTLGYFLYLQFQAWGCMKMSPWFIFSLILIIRKIFIAKFGLLYLTVWFINII